MFGYLDAGSGSMIVGAVAAGAAGVGVAMRSGWAKFRRKGSSSDAETETPVDDTEMSDEPEIAEAEPASATDTAE